MKPLYGTRPGARPTTQTLAIGGIAIGVGGLTVLGLLASGGSPIAAVGPSLALAVLYALARIPLRWSATGLVFLLLALEISTDAHGIWASPLVHLGDLLGAGSSRQLRVPLDGYELLIGYLLLVAAWRRSTSADTDGRRAIQTASIMRLSIALTVIGCVGSVVLGLANGYGPAIWKARYLLHVPLFFLFFQTALRSPEDFRWVGGAVVLAAHVKAIIATYVQLSVAPGLTGGRLACATNHGDSILFAMSILIVAIPAVERWSLKYALRAAVLLPIPLWGMLLNNRRLVWAILALSGVVIFLTTTWRPWKTRLVKSTVVLAPIILIYLGVGWSNSEASGIFTPVAKIRTMLDSDIDRSTLWREREAWNIAYSIKNNSFLGIGLGGEYTEYMFNDDISSLYPDYRGWPHNTVLGLMLLAGLPGFAAIWFPFLITIFLALRSESMSRNSYDRTSSILCIGATVACMSVAWGDTGAHFIQFKLAASISMALAAKLAVATGAWPKHERMA